MISEVNTVWVCNAFTLPIFVIKMACRKAGATDIGCFSLDFPKPSISRGYSWSGGRVKTRIGLEVTQLISIVDIPVTRWHELADHPVEVVVFIANNFAISFPQR